MSLYRALVSVTLAALSACAGERFDAENYYGTDLAYVRTQGRVLRIGDSVAVTLSGGRAGLKRAPGLHVDSVQLGVATGVWPAGWPGPDEWRFVLGGESIRIHAGSDSSAALPKRRLHVAFPPDSVTPWWPVLVVHVSRETNPNWRATNYAHLSPALVSTFRRRASSPPNQRMKLPARPPSKSSPNEE